MGASRGEREGQSSELGEGGDKSAFLFGQSAKAEQKTVVYCTRDRTNRSLVFFQNSQDRATVPYGPLQSPMRSPAIS